MFQIPEWKSLVGQRRLYITTKTAHQCMGLIKNHVKYFRSGKQPKTFDFRLLSAAVFLLQECLTVAFPESSLTRVWLEITLQTNTTLVLQRLNDLVKEAEACSLDRVESQLLPEEGSRTFLKSWIIRIRTTYGLTKLSQFPDI